MRRTRRPRSRENRVKGLGSRGKGGKMMEQICNELRAEIKEIEKRVRLLAKEPMPGPDADSSKEEIANLILSIRHLEDARMRIGKVIQAMHGGVSIYDKNA